MEAGLLGGHAREELGRRLCDECDKQQYRCQRVAEHCRWCRREFTTWDALLAHYREIRSPPRERCELCLKDIRPARRCAGAAVLVDGLRLCAECAEEMRGATVGSATVGGSH
jgi:hypothetical protein